MNIMIMGVAVIRNYGRQTMPQQINLPEMCVGKIETMYDLNMEMAI